MDKLQLKVEIRHKSNWHNETVRAARRSKFMCALVLALRKIPIYAPGGGGETLGGPTNPGYSVAISDAWATEARDKAGKAKEEKRLVPTKTDGGGKSSSVEKDEKTAAEGLNARKPTADAAHRDMDSGPAGTGAWNSRDDQTLGSRDESLERHRSNDIDDLRQGLLKRESTRGRRRPGEAMPPVPSSGGPGMMLTQASPHRETFAQSMGMGQVLDEEAALGMQRTTSSQAFPYGANANAGAGYSMFPPPTQGSRGAQQTQQRQGSSSTQQQGRLRRLSAGLKFAPSNSSRPQ